MKLAILTILSLAAGVRAQAAGGPAVGAAPALVELRGVDLQGGAGKHFGSTLHGKRGTNYVYAGPTGECSSMRARFEVVEAPREPRFLYLEALDDDFPSKARIELAVNGQALFAGLSGFSDSKWEQRRYPVPAGVLKAGANEVTVRCTDQKGTLGMPPWFCVSLLAIAGEGHTLRAPPHDLPRDFFVTLPGEKRPFPEPLPSGRSEPGFRMRGLKGWLWTPEQYLEVIPTLPGCRMNFLMICYGSLYSGFPEWKNEWWRPIPEERKRRYEEVFRSARRHGIEVVFGLHPQIAAPRPLDPASDADFEAFWRHYAWAQSRGLRWFDVPFDDVGASTAQFAFVNKLLARLREGDPESQLLFCPTWYWGDGTAPAEAKAYNEQLARELHPDVVLFWTGDAVVTPRITRRCLESYRQVTRHRVFIWDNYPVNDGAPTLHLGPVTGRDPGLCELAEGYMANPMHRQHQLGLLPLMTAADYAYNPWGYDPGRSIGQAILRLSNAPRGRQVLKDLVEAYPGMLLYGQGTGFNPVRAQLTRLMEAPHSRYVAQGYLDHMKKVLRGMEREFPRRFAAGKQTLAADLAWMRAAFSDKYGE